MTTQWRALPELIQRSRSGILGQIAMKTWWPVWIWSFGEGRWTFQARGHFSRVKCRDSYRRPSQSVT